MIVGTRRRLIFNVAFSLAACLSKRLPRGQGWLSGCSQLSSTSSGCGIYMGGCDCCGRYKWWPSATGIRSYITSDGWFSSRVEFWFCFIIGPGDPLAVFPHPFGFRKHLFIRTHFHTCCLQSVLGNRRQAEAFWFPAKTNHICINWSTACYALHRPPVPHIPTPPLRRCAPLIKQGSPEKTGPIYDHHLHVQCNLKQCLPFLCHRSQALGCRTWRAIF